MPTGIFQSDGDDVDFKFKGVTLLMLMRVRKDFGVDCLDTADYVLSSVEYPHNRYDTQ
jgi:hypothetical protein